MTVSGKTRSSQWATGCRPISYVRLGLPSWRNLVYRIIFKRKYLPAILKSPGMMSAAEWPHLAAADFSYLQYFIQADNAMLRSRKTELEVRVLFHTRPLPGNSAASQSHGNAPCLRATANLLYECTLSSALTCYVT